MATAQPPLCSDKRQSRAPLLLRIALARKSKEFCWTAIALAAGSAISSRVKERILLVNLFALIPSQGSRVLSKEANSES